MMLTPVTEAKSARDQSRDSRNSRIVAPADSRLTVAFRPYSDSTQAYRLSWLYTFLSLFSCQIRLRVYTLPHTFWSEGGSDGASVLSKPGIVVRLRR
jgi:hypothetical protein